MKLILKLAALILALGSVACLVQAKKELICRTCPCEGDIEDEYETWED